MSEKKPMGIESLAIIITVISGLFTVLYSEGYFSIWDFAIGVFVVFISVQYRKELSRSNTEFLIARSGLSVGTAIVFMTLITIVSKETAKSIQSIRFNIFDGLFLITFIIYILSLFVYKKGD